MIDLVHIVRLRSARIVAAVVLVALAAIAFLPARAGAGIYTATQCHPSYGAGHDDAIFSRSSSDFFGTAGCAHGGGGLRIAHTESQTLIGRRAGWSFAAPAGTSIVGARIRAWGRSAGGLVPEVLEGSSGAMRAIGHATGKPHRISWTGQAQDLAARLECRRSPHCAASNEARFAVNRIRLRISDPVKPGLGLGGVFADQRVVRGTQLLGALAGDAGSGVAGLTLDVNGRQTASRQLACALHGRVAIRLSPCPPSAALSVPENTKASPFRQGTNHIQVCARDYAARHDANVNCVSRKVRVDNRCPLSGVPGGTSLTAGVRGVRRGFTASRHDRPRISGRVLDSAGEPVSGAKVCVAAQRLPHHAAESILATPITDADGHYAVAIPPGPGRRLRVAYWENDQHALQRFERIRFRARPHLRLRPRGTIRNGDRVHFIVHLPGPDAGRRLVRIEALSHHHWVPVTGGRTGSSGVYHGSYRFHETTRTRSYRFRALVPHQAGYPYAAGASSVKRKRVRG